MKQLFQTTKRFARNSFLLLSALVIVAVPQAHANALTAEGLYTLGQERGLFDPSSQCSTTATVPTGTTTAVTGSSEQVKNAKIVMGIAKTYNLGEKGALIGLMTALQESGLKQYASSTVPISKENPAWLALPQPRPIGNDHDSVGIMQQRVSSNWSTYGSGETKEIVFQLMDPAYSAQAFFGTPKNAKLPDGLKSPSALKKGLQNLKTDWKTMDPGSAAQAVQISAFPDAYAKQRPRAQSYIDQYWSTTPAIPLPIPITGEAPATETTATAGSTIACATPLSAPAGTGVTAIKNKIFEYAWPNYCKSSSNTCNGYDSPIALKGEYAQAVERAKKGGYIGDTCHGGGVDCGAFVTIVMRESGADPAYNTKPQGNTKQQMDYLRRNSGPGKKYTRVTDLKALQTGDIAVQNNGSTHHTYFYVGKMTGPKGEAFNGDSASASQCDRAPMAGPTDSREKYEWYRLN